VLEAEGSVSEGQKTDPFPFRIGIYSPAYSALANCTGSSGQRMLRTEQPRRGRSPRTAGDIQPPLNLARRQGADGLGAADRTQSGMVGAKARLGGSIACGILSARDSCLSENACALAENVWRFREGAGSDGEGCGTMCEKRARRRKQLGGSEVGTADVAGARMPRPAGWDYNGNIIFSFSAGASSCFCRCEERESYEDNKANVL